MKLIVALNCENALGLVNKLGDLCDLYKVGIQCPDYLIDHLHLKGKKIFLDYKFYDTSDTIKQAIERINKRKIYMATVHPDCVEPAMSIQGNTKIFPVTALTSEHGISWHKISSNAFIASEFKAAGVVLPASYGREIKSRYPDLELVSPGIRLYGEPTNNHIHTATLTAAKQNLIDYIVVGRPICEAKDPVEAARNYIDG
jgi:orotidine-5'-phosphate decarboxylase